MLVWPQAEAIQIIDKAIAIWANDWHVACRVYQRFLQGCTFCVFFFSLQKARGKTHSPTRATVAQLAHNIDGGISVHGNKSCVWYNRQIGDAAISGHTRYRIHLWMHGIEHAFKA